MNSTKQEIIDNGEIIRRQELLKIVMLEVTTPTEENVTVTQRVEFNVDGSIPELAQAIAELAAGLDRELVEEGKVGLAGEGLLTLTREIYNKLTASDAEKGN